MAQRTFPEHLPGVAEAGSESLPFLYTSAEGTISTLSLDTHSLAPGVCHMLYQAPSTPQKEGQTRRPWGPSPTLPEY